jgi:predicted rRNA methylase YqxC with S4 and FtsJ domains
LREFERIERFERTERTERIERFERIETETETETEKLPIEFAVQIISFRSLHDAIPQLHVQVSRRH